jgi:hypothetical protein
VIGRSGTAICAHSANSGAIERGRRLPYCLLLVALMLGAAILQRDGGAKFPTTKAQTSAHWAHLYAALPLSFEANFGQTDPSVSFISRGQGYTLFLTRREAVLTLKRPSSEAPGKTVPVETALHLKLLGANSSSAVVGEDELPGKVNYLIGNDPSQWLRNVPTYAKVKYESIYPGIDLVYYGAQGGKLEYDFVVAPGANPEAISLGLEMQDNAAMRISPEGDLVLALPGGDVRLHHPVVYQAIPERAKRATGRGRRVPVEGRYTLDAQNHLRFDLGPYDHHRPLVIDPVLVYATYVGGSGGDVGYSIAVDTLLDAYIAGATNSSNFPTAGKPYQSASKGNGDCFVTKINSNGTALIYSTYLGGSGTDAALALAVSNGSVYLTGYTTSSDFPALSPVANTNPFQLTYGGNTDAFATVLDTTGSSLVYSTYLGGNGSDYGQGIAVDASGYAYVTGSTQSSNFPIVAGALQTSLKGSQNAFVAKVNLTGQALVYSTYLGGSAADVAQSIQVDGAGDAYLAGYTNSPDFPTQSPMQKSNAGGADAFVAELNPGGSALTFSTFLGGSADDRAYGLALDSLQTPNIYVTGSTSSTDFPTTSGAFQTKLNGVSNAFVSKLNSSGSSVVYSTYLGGSDTDQGNAIAVTSAGVAFVTGFTESTDFPTQNPVQSILGLSSSTIYCGNSPCADAFVTQLNAAGNALTYSTYLGGNGADFGQSIALDNTGDPYITGSTSSTNFPIVSPPQSNTTYVPPYKSTLVGTAGNAFIAKIDSGNNPNISIEPGSLNFGNETVSVPSAVLPITIVNPSTAPLVITQIQVGVVANSTTIYTETDNCVGTLDAGGAYCTIYVTFTPNATGTITDTITLTDNAGETPGTEQTISLTGVGVTAATAVTVQPSSLSFSSTAVGSPSAPQSVTITNTGTEPLTISKIGVGTSLDFTVTNPQTGGQSSTCLALNNILAVSQSCSVQVWFTPTASGTRNGTLSISDNASGSPQTVALTGIGTAAFTLSSPSAVNPTIIGSTQTTFVIVANGPTSFTGAITLACSSGSTCAFSQNPIFVAGQSSTLTISNLTTGLSNPYLFTVTGTSGTQTFSLQLSLGFSDFTLTASPSSATVTAGHPATYTIFVNPLNGFNGSVQLVESKTTPALNATYSYTPNPVTVNGTSPAAVTVVVGTYTYIAPPTNAHAPPSFPKNQFWPTACGLLMLTGLGSLALGNRRRTRKGWFGSSWMTVRLATISLILALNLALVGCRSSVLLISGTTTGGYVITLAGSLTSNTSVIRTVVIDLAVTSSNPV